MPLQRKHIDIRVNGGRNSKVAEELLESPVVVEVKNVDNSEVGALNQREGYEQLTLTELNGAAAPTSLRRLAKHDGSLLLVGNDTLYRYLETPDRTLMQPKGVRAFYAANSTRHVLQDTEPGDHKFPDIAVAGDYLVASYLGDDDSGTAKINWVVMYKDTHEIVAEGSFASHSSNPLGGKLVTIGNVVLMVWRGSTSGTLRAATMDTATSRVFSADSQIASGVSTASYHFDIATDGTDLYVVWAGDEASLHVEKWNTSLVSQASTSVANEQEDGAIACMWSAQASSLFVVLWEDLGASNALQDHKFNAALSTHSTRVLETGLATVQEITLCEGDSDEHVVFYSTNSATVWHTVSDDLSANAKEKTLQYMFLVHRAVRKDTNTVLVGMTNGLGLSSYYTMRLDLSDIDNLVEPVAKYAFLSAGIAPLESHVSSFVADGDSYRWAGILRTRQRVDDGNQLVSRNATCEFISDFAEPQLSHGVELGGTTIFSGSVVQRYTGRDTPDLGFIAPPFTPGVAGNVDGSGNMTANRNYTYIIVFEEVDNKGNVHRSMQSLPVTVFLSSGSSHDSATVSVRTPVVRDQKKVRRGIYRTEGDSAGPFYRVNSDESDAGLNFLDAETYSIYTDLDADSTIINNELLYTTGGLFENQAAPPCRAIAKHRNRIFVVGDEDESIWPSHAHVTGNGVAFNDALRVQTSEHGKPVAMCSLKSMLAVFWTDKVGVLHGAGVDRLGRGAQYQLQVLPGDAGCTDQRSVVEIPRGVMFKSARGWRLLTRDLQVLPIGLEVDDYDSETVVSADLVESAHEVRICLGDTGGTVLVYEYQQNTWQVYDSIIGGSDKIVDATTLGGRHVLIDDSDKLWKQTSTATKPSPTVRTAHHKFAGLQGFQRVRRLWLYGDFDAASALSVKFFYDKEAVASFTRTATINGTQYQIGMPRQKCELVQLEIAGFRRLVSYRFEYAVKRGGAKTVTQIVS